MEVNKTNNDAPCRKNLNTLLTTTIVFSTGFTFLIVDMTPTGPVIKHL